MYKVVVSKYDMQTFQFTKLRTARRWVWQLISIGVGENNISIINAKGKKCKSQYGAD